MNAFQRPGRAAAVVGAVVAVSAATLLGVVAGSAAAQEPGRCTDNVNVRESPSLDARIVALCEEGTAVLVGDSRNGFVELIDLGGWAAEEFVEIDETRAFTPGGSTPADDEDGTTPPGAGTPGEEIDEPGPSNTGPSNTGPSNTGPSNTGPSNTGPSNTGPSNTGPSNTGPSSTGPSGTEPPTRDPSVPPQQPEDGADVEGPSGVAPVPDPVGSLVPRVI